MPDYMAVSSALGILEGCDYPSHDIAWGTYCEIIGDNEISCACGNMNAAVSVGAVSDVGFVQV